MTSDDRHFPIEKNRRYYVAKKLSVSVTILTYMNDASWGFTTWQKEFELFCKKTVINYFV